jgi:hypothetical protein
MTLVVVIVAVVPEPVMIRRNTFVVSVDVDTKFPPQVHTALVTLVTVPDEMVMSEVVVTSHDAALVIVEVYPALTEKF